MARNSEYRYRQFRTDTQEWSPVTTLLPEGLAEWLLGSSDPPALVFGAFLGAALLGTGIMTNAAVVVWMKRKVLASYWEKLGPTKLGPGGIFIILADAVRLLSKELIIPEDVDRPAWDLAPLVLVVPIIVGFAVIPMGAVGNVRIQLADPEVGLAFVFAVSSVSAAGLVMAGYASANKFSLIGGLRAVAQTLAYEIPLVVSGLSVVLMAGSLRTSEIVAAQEGTLLALGPLSIPAWYGFLNPLAFILFLVATFAEVGRNPFDMAEAPQEIIAGHQTEYGGVYFALLYVGEFLHIFLGGALIATLFLGGPAGPLFPGFVWFVLKCWAVFLFTQWARASIPRLRIDQLIDLGWKVLLVLSFGTLLVTAIAVGLTA